MGLSIGFGVLIGLWFIFGGAIPAVQKGMEKDKQSSSCKHHKQCTHQQSYHEYSNGGTTEP